MKTKKIKELSPAELQKKLTDSRDELLNLKVRKQVGQVEKPHRIKELKRSIARMMTILNESENSVSKN